MGKTRDHIPNRFAGQKPADIGHRSLDHTGDAATTPSAAMRRHDHRRQVGKGIAAVGLMLEHVQRCPPQVFPYHGSPQRVLVDQTATSGIDEV